MEESAVKQIIFLLVQRDLVFFILIFALSLRVDRVCNGDLTAKV
jgi:hypothetical protein